MKKNSRIIYTVKLLSKNEIISILIVLISASVGMALEFLSLSTIPIFFSALLGTGIEDTNLISKIKNLNTRFFNDLNNILLFVVLIFFFKSTFLYLVQIFEFSVFKRIRLRLCNILIEKYIKPDFNLESKDSAATKIWKIEIINNFVGVIENFASLIRNTGYIFAIIIFLILYSSIVVLYFILVLFMLLFLYFFLISNKLKKTGQLSDLGRKDKVNTIQDIVNGIKDINILKKFDYFLQKFKFSNITLEKYNQKNLIISKFPFYYLEFFGVLVIILFFFFLLKQNFENTEILISISLLTYGGMRIIGLLKTCVNNINLYKKSSFVIGVLFDEFYEKLDHTKKNINLIKYKDTLNDNKILTIKNLSYNYHNGKQIFNNLNLEFQTNKIYCLIGESGSGKSTFLDLILGLKNFETGDITIKCKDYEVGYVPQECYISEGTIESNIAFGVFRKNVNRENLINSAKEAQIYDFINSLPEKFNSKISSFGSNISVGQKQRIGIARTLYNNSKILLLDEPTSALDPATEEKFMNILKTLKKNRLIIITTHRNNLKENYDYTLKLENNSIKQIKI
jgi:ABC-type multidrug transport system fused ATPase/permease subunit